MYKTVTIFLTEFCNLSCIYCYEENKSHTIITLEKAKSIIDYEFKNCDEHDGIIIELFGGEPFIAFERMKQIVEYLRSKSWNVPFLISITTNGTLVHGKIQEWLLNNQDLINITLSMDGNAEMQNINRSNSFDKIDLDFFKNWPGEPHVKMTISTSTLPMMADGIKFLHSEGFGIDCNFAYGIDWEDEKLLSILEEQFRKLIDFYVANPDIKPCSLLSYKIEGITYSYKESTRRWCGTGKHMCAYSVDGDCYPCQFFAPISVGSKAILLKDFDIPEKIPRELLSSKCVNCIFASICPTCYGSSYCETGNFYEKSQGFCNITKLAILANSYLRWRKIEEEENEEKRMRILKAIELIQTTLKNDPVISKI